MEEPSVLDLLRATLRFWQPRPPSMPSLRDAVTGDTSAVTETTATTATRADSTSAPRSAYPPAWWPRSAVTPWPWALLFALGLGLAGQGLLEPPRGGPFPGLVLYLFAAAALVWAVRRGQLEVPPPPATTFTPPAPRPRWWLLAVGLGLAAGVFALTGDLRLTLPSLALHLAAVATVVAAALPGSIRSAATAGRVALDLFRRDWTITVPRWAVPAVAGLGVIALFRLAGLDQVPAEMVSEHAELLGDVVMVRAGEWPVFFAGSWFREGLHPYLAAALSPLLPDPLSFLTLKLPTVLAGLLTLPCLVLLGREVGGLRVGLLAAFFAGVGSWPNIISRLGLPFALVPLFVALALAALLAGLRTGRRGHLLLAGLAVGLGLWSASIGRAGALAAVVVASLSVAGPTAAGRRRRLLVGLTLAALVAVTVTTPLLRAAVTEPEAVFRTALTRMTAAEGPIPGHPVVVAVSNLGRALAMFGWSGGRSWLAGVSGRPALDVVGATLFHLGLALVLVTAWRRPNRPALAVAAALPVLLAPSFLALAFPAENPSLERAAGALVPAYLLVGVGADAVYTGLRRCGGRLVAPAALIALAVASGVAGWRLTHTEYGGSYRQQSWNTSELGAVAKTFALGAGTPNTVHVVPAPHWVDTRLVAVEAGLPGRDLALEADALSRTSREPRPQLFLLHPDDETSCARLARLFPTGVLVRHRGVVEGKDFLAFFVPPRPAGAP